MAGFFLHVGATIMCPHGGSVSIISLNNRVLVRNQPVATLNDTFLVCGCPFSLSSIHPPHPCTTVTWIAPATRVFVNSRPVVLGTSIGSCQSADQTPQGPPNVLKTQMRVRGF